MIPDPNSDPRFAGTVERWHVYPTVQRQTVGEHTWQVCRILLAIYPECDVQLLTAALLHDVGEVKAGDMPFPTKRSSPAMSEMMDKLERDAHLSMVIPWRLPAPALLTDEASWILKLADVIEMWEFGAQEILLGNKFARLICQRTEQAVDVLLQLPFADSVKESVRTYIAARNRAWSIGTYKAGVIS